MAEDLSNSLSHKQGAKNVREIIIDIRTHLNGQNYGLKSKDVIVFSEPDLMGGRLNTSAVTSEARVKPKPFK